MRRSRVQGLIKLGSISEIVCYVARSNHAKFHAFITKVNNSAIFWTLALVLSCILASQNCSSLSPVAPGFSYTAVSRKVVLQKCKSVHDKVERYYR